MSKKQNPKEPGEARSRKTDERPADVRFAERVNTELAQWERRFDNLQKLAYGRLAKGATQAQLDALLEHLQRQHEATMTAIRSIPERAALTSATSPATTRAPFMAVPGAPAKVYTPKQA